MQQWPAHQNKYKYIHSSNACFNYLFPWCSPRDPIFLNILSPCSSPNIRYVTLNVCSSYLFPCHFWLGCKTEYRIEVYDIQTKAWTWAPGKKARVCSSWRGREDGRSGSPMRRDSRGPVETEMDCYGARDVQLGELRGSSFQSNLSNAKFHATVPMFQSYPLFLSESFVITQQHLQQQYRRPHNSEIFLFLREW